MVSQVEITKEKKEIAEAQIRDRRKVVDYNTLKYPIEILVQKYLNGIDEDENEIFIPDYQREMSWDEDRQSKFVESVLLGLPIPYIFVADISDNEDLGRLEIIDGTQRIRTLARFLNNELKLNNLEKLERLNGFTFGDLPLSRQRRFQRTTIRIQKNKSFDNLINDINCISLDIISASFDKQQLFSGNIDARKIKNTAEAYGFSYRTNARKTQDGNDLLKIKANRNDLAHGFKSFGEVGKDATAEELLQIKERVICYLRDILGNIENYILEKKYLE